jgi:hypothetical protein
MAELEERNPGYDNNKTKTGCFNNSNGSSTSSKNKPEFG